MILSPSVIAADLGRLEDQIAEALDAGAGWIHVDVMDGRFVPNITIGPLVVRALRPLADEKRALLDVHLMIVEPDRYLEEFADAGADLMTVHVEACTHLHRTIHRIRELGVKPGVTLNPATPLSAVEEILPDVDLAVVMSVNPGFSGQRYIASSTDRVRRLRHLLDRMDSGAYLQVDGGITAANVKEVISAGANVVVAGNAVFGGPRSIADNVRALREATLLEA